MAMLRQSNGIWRAIVRRKGDAAQSKSFPTKTAAKTWPDRIERELADLDARGSTPGENITIAELITWRTEALASVKAVSKTRAGNMARLQEGSGTFQPDASLPAM